MMKETKKHGDDTATHHSHGMCRITHQNRARLREEPDLKRMVCNAVGGRVQEKLGAPHAIMMEEKMKDADTQMTPEPLPQTTFVG